jgi:hypothetical protein
LACILLRAFWVKLFPKGGKKKAKPLPMFILKVSGVGGGLCPVGYALIFCGIAQKWAYFCVNLKAILLRLN